MRSFGYNWSICKNLELWGGGGGELQKLKILVFELKNFVNF
jgi:hypothetical protein